MFIEDLKKNFYNVLIGKRVLILVNYDIDAICACKILQFLFRSDDIIYTLIPVQGVTDLQNAYEENSEEIKYVLLINCGGTIDIIETLQPKEDVIIFVVDSHRPTDVCNVYNDGQVKILTKHEDEEGIPNFEDLFKDDESDGDNSGGESDEESRVAKRRRLGEEAILKRRERRLWEENRDRLMFEYSQFSYYGRSSAMLMFELAWKMSKDNNDLLWWAIVAVTEQMLLGKVEHQQYVLETGGLQGHVSRLGAQLGEEETFRNSLKITYDKDLQLALYRHWTVESSLRYSTFSACKLKLWTLKGEKRLHELLAEMGLPLAQSRQNFSAMDMDLRQGFHAMVERLADKYGMTDLVYASFLLQHGFRGRYCASDVVYAMLALLESTGRERASGDGFLEAMDCLSRLKKNVLDGGIEKAKKFLVVIFKQVQNLLDMKLVVSAGPFVYLVLQEGLLDTRMFAHLHRLTLLAQFALQAYVAMSRNKRAPSLPLVASAPYGLSEGTCLVVGIPPVCEDSPKNFFGKAFEQAAEKTGARIAPDFFDTSAVLLKTEDRAKFFDALTTLLS